MIAVGEAFSSCHECWTDLLPFWLHCKEEFEIVIVLRGIASAKKS